MGGEGEEGWVNLDGRDRVMNINLFFSLFYHKKGAVLINVVIMLPYFVLII